MRIFIDESGAFRTDRDSVEETAVVVGVAVPSSVEAVLATRFGEVRTALLGHARPRSELKGWTLTPEARRRVCRLLDSFSRVLVRPVIVDLRHFRDAFVGGLKSELHEGLRRIARAIPDPVYRQEFEDLARWHGNLSDPQIVRLYSWANCIDRTLRDVAMQLVPASERGSWAEIELVVDGRPSHLEGREGRFFSKMLMNWLVVWSHEAPFGSVALGGEQHPLLEHFGAGGGLQIQHLVERGLRFQDSRDEVGLQIADIAAAIVGRAALTRGTDPEALAIYGSLMKRASERAKCGIGLVTDSPDRSVGPATDFLPLIREYDLAQVRRAASLPGASFLTCPTCGEKPDLLVLPGLGVLTDRNGDLWLEERPSPAS